MRERRSLVVELEDLDGARGYGESAPFEAPFYSSETTSSARACLVEWLLPRLVGRDVSDTQELAELLRDGIRGNEMAKAGVDTAWWDLAAARQGVPLATLVTRRLDALGVAPGLVERRDRIECGVALGIPEHGDLRALRHEVEAALLRGYRRIKLKVRPGWDVAAVRATREVMGGAYPEVPLTVDANGAYDLGTHQGALRGLDALGLLYIEQPLPGNMLWDLAELGRRIATPVCLDETLTSAAVGRQVLALDGPTVWNLKIQRVGGLEEACRIYALACEAGVRLWAGTMPETGLGAQAMLALACHAGFTYPSDLEPSDRWYPPGTDLVALEMDADGTMPVPSERPSLELAARGARLVHETF
jgi:O-succinylbenzoate synthase